MSEEIIVRNCSPTLAGIKTGSLFACPSEEPSVLRDSLRQLNRCLVPRGARILPLRVSRERVLLYVYRPARLRRDLQAAQAVRILRELHYPVGDSERCVCELIRRMNRNGDFPHEIGLFLGYPPEDVEGFMRHGARDAKCVGTWKVYGDETAARRQFARFHKCTRLYIDAWRRHASLDRLIVSCSNK